MDIKITPGLLAGKINAIPSKSHGHRLLISNTLAALCDLAGDSNVASALKSTETEKARAVIERSVNEIDTGHNSTDISATRECLLSLADQVPEMVCRSRCRPRKSRGRVFPSPLVSKSAAGSCCRT